MPDGINISGAPDEKPYDKFEVECVSSRLFTLIACMREFKHETKDAWPVARLEYIRGDLLDMAAEEVAKLVELTED